LEYNWVDSNRLRYGCVKPEHLSRGGFVRSLPGEKGEKGGATEKEKEKARPQVVSNVILLSQKFGHDPI